MAAPQRLAANQPHCGLIRLSSWLKLVLPRGPFILNVPAIIAIRIFQSGWLSMAWPSSDVVPLTPWDDSTILMDDNGGWEAERNGHMLRTCCKTRLTLSTACEERLVALRLRGLSQTHPSPRQRYRAPTATDCKTRHQEMKYCLTVKHYDDQEAQLSLCLLVFLHF